MRVVNDKEESQEPIEVGLLALCTHSIFCAFGFMTTFFSPIPVLLAHLRLTNPWPRVSALIGAVLAVTFFQVPLPLVLITFVVSLFAADAITKGTPFWGFLGSSLLVAMGAAALALYASASMHQSDIIHQWVAAVDAVLTQTKEVLAFQEPQQWEALRRTLIVEGPFLYLVAVLLSLWITVGLSAHLGWMSESARYSANGLRKIRLPAWVSFVFVALYVATYFARSDTAHLVSGLSRMAGAVLFIQGMVMLSRLLGMRSVRPPLRAFIYSFALTFGFYIVVGLGVMSPWYHLRKTRRVHESHT